MLERHDGIRISMPEACHRAEEIWEEMASTEKEYYKAIAADLRKSPEGQRFTQEQRQKQKLYRLQG